MPEELRRQNRIVKWAGIAVVALSALYVYPAEGTALKTTLFTAFYLMMIAAAIVMVVALVKIRRCFVDQGLGRQVRPKRMVVHALSFIVYITTFIVIVAIQHIKTSSVNYYFGWFLDTTTGFISYVCLFFVIWHLGSSRADDSDAASSNSTIEEDQETE